MDIPESQKWPESQFNGHIRFLYGVTQQGQVLVSDQYTLFLNDHTSNAIDMRWYRICMKIPEVFMPLWRIYISLIFVNAKVEFTVVFNDGLIKG